MADAAMELNDKNQDGVLDEQELLAAPGLKAAAEAEGGSADLDGDGKLSRDEIRDRIAWYEESGQGISLTSVIILNKKRPLAGATVEVVPEPFLKGVLESAQDQTDVAGRARPAIQTEDIPGLRPGMYRVKVTAPSQDLAANYNENTELGIEITAPREGYGASTPPTFDVGE